MFLIDTNIAIHLRDGFEPALRRLSSHSDVVAMSALTLAELQRGLASAPELRPIREARLAVILNAIPVLPFDAAAAEAYGRIRSALGWSRSMPRE